MALRNSPIQKFQCYKTVSPWKTFLAIQLLLPFSYYAFSFCSFSSFMKLIVVGQQLWIYVKYMWHIHSHMNSLVYTHSNVVCSALLLCLQYVVPSWLNLYASLLIICIQGLFPSKFNLPFFMIIFSSTF